MRRYYQSFVLFLFWGFTPLAITFLLLSCRNNELCPTCPPTSGDSLVLISYPIWSKDGKTIFGFGGTEGLQGDEIWQVDSSGGFARRILRDSLSKWSLTLSPDGLKLAYEAAPYGSLLCCAHVWVVNIDGTNAHDLTPWPGNWDHIRWSPDSRYLIFDGGVMDSGASNYQIARADVQTGEVKLLTRASNYSNLDATYLSDGQRIVYLSGRIMTDYGGKVWVMNADGTNPAPIDTSPTASAYPRPSSVRNDLYFFWGLGGEGDRGEYAVNLDTTVLPTLKSSFHNIYKYALDKMQWSPDGNFILYPVATSTLALDLFLMNRDGTNQRQLTSGFYVYWGPYAWSPDSKRLLIDAHDLNKQKYALYIFDLPTNTLRTVNIKRPP